MLLSFKIPPSQTTCCFIQLPASYNPMGWPWHPWSHSVVSAARGKPRESPRAVRSLAVGAPHCLFPPASIFSLFLPWLLMPEWVMYNSDTFGGNAWRRTSISPEWTCAKFRLAVPYSFVGNPFALLLCSLAFTLFKHMFLLSCWHPVSSSDKHNSSWGPL